MLLKDEAIFVDIDTQYDFMSPKGKLYVKNAEKIIPNLKKLISYALKNKIPIIASVDTHKEDDPEFKQFPPHCVKGTYGHEKIPETKVPNYEIVENELKDIELEPEKEIIIEKKVFSLFDNVNTERILKKIARSKVVIFGVATEYCVRASAEGFLNIGFQVLIVKDAIKAISEEEGKKTLEELIKKGAKLVTTEEIITKNL